MPLMYGSPVMIELIKKMPVGSKWEIFWPAKLPYGPDGINGLVPPEALIIWELELLEAQAMGTSPAQ
jgi:FKBP-type peptidyl-prolyl cis-trans isomerase FklB